VNIFTASLSVVANSVFMPPPREASSEPAALHIPVGHAVHDATGFASAEVDKYSPAAQFDWVVHVVAASIPVRALAPVIDNLTLVVAPDPASRVVPQAVAAPTAVAVAAVER
jgi:hypothetical protein